MANAQGIDVSSYQGAFDWAAEKGSISFAFAKATEGSTITDPEFARNWQQIKAIGIVRGAYHFAHPKDGAATDARAFLAVVRAQGLASGDMLALDLETTDGLAPAQVAAYARNWCAEVAAATGRKPIVYTFISFAQARQLRRTRRPPAVDRRPVQPGRAPHRPPAVDHVGLSPVRDDARGPGRVQRGHGRAEEVRQPSRRTEAGGRSADRNPRQRRERRHADLDPVRQRQGDRFRL